MFCATVTVPSALTVNGPFGVEVNTTSAGLTTVPFKVSLVNTLIPASPPLVPFTGVLLVSATALITAAVTFIVTEFVAQLPGFNSSHMV
ncbi:hypothetical protein D3C84_827040 [compost metagenome]